ncbi:unnamed protein product [Linum tenue]|uniref:NAC domain-containing protein n=1 Tax=Linum tenue TaxID=586396 RepID=A0AAV0LID1_9ROSI|nr:unnamed protein product [Linum tenue]
MSSMVHHQSPVIPDQFPILGSGMNSNNMLPTSPNYSFDEGDNRFCPCDERLISYYLIPKRLGNEDQTIQIPEVDILNHEPWDLLPTGGEQRYKEAHYFCRRRSYFTSKDRYKRTTGGGYWKPTGKHREIRRAADGELIGSKRSLVFHYGRPAGQATGYTMHEYSVPNSIGQTTLREDLVLCKIMKKISNHNNKTETTARKLSKKRKKAAITPIIPSNENINTITLPRQEEEEAGYQNASFEEAVSNDHGGTMELAPFPEILFRDGDDHSQLPDFDYDFNFDIDFYSAVRDILPPPEPESESEP